ncbi:beta-galactosidase [Solitalea sp. MAHUQ-68]|uniref:Beta-galactosidase n=1 Tax=Solitalea agri TaxID=2953739 RepID=A0A9X2FDA0_9SPHI|nr:beta-galactosidase [Solitalea agri]MCO4294733.1 beta-galactosidase [Solitalea agri]
MKRILLVCLLAYGQLVFAQNATKQTDDLLPKTSGALTLGQKEFLLNGKPFLIRAGELHFPRIPREYWDHRIKLCKAMGMNTICIYLFWNFHEQNPDQFDFNGQKDVAAFVKLVQANGMYCIVRPGPYVCAEWDMGGLPWWLLKKADLKVRTLDDRYFVERSAKFLREVGKQLAPLQIQNGGNIIMVQVENEYSGFGNSSEYMEATRKNLRAAGFDKVQLMRCDWSSTFDSYKTDPEVAITLNFGAGSDVDKQFKRFQDAYPNAPLMCSEYWTGWFDHWGRPHETRSISSFIGSLKDMMDRKISFSLYMAHGGTSFGQWGGANSPPYSAMVTSYDYNAPIGEQGTTTDKFFAVRDLLKNYLNPGEQLGEIPAPIPLISIPKITFEERASLFDNLPHGKNSESIKPMEMFDQGWGRINYRTKLTESSIPRKLIITEAHDWAQVFIDGRLIGKLDRRRADSIIEIPKTRANAVLDILVEATGRVNFGEAVIDRKGITEKVEISDGSTTKELKDWTVYNFPVEYRFQSNMKFSKQKGNGPAWYRTKFTLDQTGDTYIDLSTWGKGMIWINGYNIGRFWKIGPQQTLFMPGAWLKKGENEIIILDLEGPKEAAIQGLTEPILDKIKPDASLLNRREGQNLVLENEKPVYEGSFDAAEGWKEVHFTNRANGRYFCFEALSAQGTNDNNTSIAELQLLGKDGKPISTQKWKVIYADSEEVTAANNSADKVFDNQESTFWHTQYIGGSQTAKQPHQIVIDLGGAVEISGFRYLPRSDKSKNGMVKDYRVYLNNSIFKGL